MSTFRLDIVIAVAFALALAATAPLMAQSGRQGKPDKAEPEAHRDAAAAAQRSLSTSVRRVERESRGRVLSAEAMQFDGRVVNRIKVLDDRGRVRVYVDDPSDPGRPRPTRGDDD